MNIFFKVIFVVYLICVSFCESKTEKCISNEHFMKEWFADTTTDVQIEKEVIDIKVYPNPAISAFVIEFIEDLDDATINLYDNLGRNVIAKRNVNSKKIEIKFEEIKINAGNYIIEIQTKYRKFTKKIMLIE